MVTAKSAVYYRWRYLDCPCQVGFIAVAEERCLAMIWAFRKTYSVNGNQKEFLEAFDWFCLPDMRGSGFGTRVMNYMMGLGYPIITVGGSPDSIRLLPRLKWQEISSAGQYTLHLGGRMVGASLHRRYGIPVPIGERLFRWGIGRRYRPKGKPAPPRAVVIPVAAPGPEVLDLYRETAGWGLLPLPNTDFLRWLTTGFTAAGHFIPLYFLIGDKLRAWSLGRVYCTPQGVEGQIVDAFSPMMDQQIYSWIVFETVKTLNAFEPDTITTWTANPLLAEALTNNRFVISGSLPVLVWPPGFELPRSMLHVGTNTSDLCLIPYSAPWSY